MNNCHLCNNVYHKFYTCTCEYCCNRKVCEMCYIINNLNNITKCYKREYKQEDYDEFYFKTKVTCTDDNHETKLHICYYYKYCKTCKKICCNVCYFNKHVKH